MTATETARSLVTEIVVGGFKHFSRWGEGAKAVVGGIWIFLLQREGVFRVRRVK